MGVVLFAFYFKEPSTCTAVPQLLLQQNQGFFGFSVLLKTVEGSKTTSVKTKSELLPYSEGSNVLQPATDTRTFPFPNIRASTSVPSTKFGAPLWLM